MGIFQIVEGILGRDLKSISFKTPKLIIRVFGDEISDTYRKTVSEELLENLKDHGITEVELTL